ncbi:MAG: hypothetical protein A4E55_01576 [Pelotomaculum sp. PtaU1.Bin035]|nr:MAG: hypothetical protein A4E55_01576 [Pelotomaculum sp. PtaU1.Bin035]
MTDLKARVAYLQGLSAGLDLNADSKEGKLFDGIIEILDQFADSMVDLEEGHDQIEDYLEKIDEDLYHLEDEIYGDDDVNHSGGTEDFIEVDCPGCGETVYFDSHIPDDDDIVEVICPNCDERVFTNDKGLQVGDKPEKLGGRVAESSQEAHNEDM